MFDQRCQHYTNHFVQYFATALATTINDKTARLFLLHFFRRSDSNSARLCYLTSEFICPRSLLFHILALMNTNVSNIAKSEARSVFQDGRLLVILVLGRCIFSLILSFLFLLLPSSHLDEAVRLTISSAFFVAVLCTGCGIHD